MPPTTDEFRKLIALRECLQDLALDKDATRDASRAFTALLPGLRAVFGPAFPAAVHAHLDAIEADILAGRVRPALVRDRAAAISDALGIGMLEPQREARTAPAS